MAYILTTEAEIRQKAGDGLSISFGTIEMTAANIRAESVVNCTARYDFSRNPLTISAFGGILSDICSSLVAVEAISYDMSGYDSRTEAEDMINVNRDIALRGLGILRDKKVQKFMRGE